MTAEVRSYARPKTPLEKAPEPAYGTDPITKTRYTDPEFMRLYKVYESSALALKKAVDEVSEEDGLDISEHSERAYELPWSIGYALL